MSVSRRQRMLDHIAAHPGLTCSQVLNAMHEAMSEPPSDYQGILMHMIAVGEVRLRDGVLEPWEAKA